MVETLKKAIKKLYHLFPKSPNSPGKEVIRMVETLKKAIATAEEGLRKVGEAEYAERLGLLRREYEVAKLRLVVFGEFSRGKSTLINALLGRVVLPAKAMPTTDHVTRVAWAFWGRFFK